MVVGLHELPQVNNLSRPLSDVNHLLSSMLAVMILVASVAYGLIIRPLWLNQTALPLELVFLSASVMVMAQALCLGYQWQSLMNNVNAKITRAFPTILLLFVIGILIGTWILSGTVPMLVYLGLDLVSEHYFYALAFLLSVVFSLCTGSSWSTIATIGVVLITVGQTANAHLGLLAGAVIGGAYFGDKMSPLSDTTNIAAIAVGVSVQAHINAMKYTTIPAAVLALCAYIILGFYYPVASTAAQENVLLTFQAQLHGLFKFSYWLLLPPIIILIGSIKRFPPLPTLVVSSFSACLLALYFQAISLEQVFTTIHKGFDLSLFVSTANMTADTSGIAVDSILNRGGLYFLIDPIVITILIFVYVGVVDEMGAITRTLSAMLLKIKRDSSLVVSTLFASSLTNSLTSSQYANSFIVSEVFSKKYREHKLPKPLLSRSLEDTGTMIESLVPWSTTAVFIYATLDIAITEYWYWQFMSLFNIAVALLLAIFAIDYSKNRTR